MNNSLQTRVRNWVIGCFGQKSFESKRERSARLVEEAIELAQACGLEKDYVGKILDIVYSKPVGEVKQEVGGVAVCLLALSDSYGFFAGDALEEEVRRLEKVPVGYFRRRHQAKTDAGIALQHTS